MILVTGAAGKTGRAIVRALRGRERVIRALAHTNEQIQLLEQLGAADVRVGDMRSLQTMNEACRGVQALYHICPNVSPQELQIGQVMIEAALAAEVQHVVYHSVLHPQIELMPHHWQKMRVEEQLFESGLAYTILQPAPYMQNIAAYWEQIVATGRYSVPYSEKTRLSLVDLEDVAEVAALVLSHPGHHAATYELCGSELLSQSEIGQILSQFLSRSVKVERVPLEDWKGGARKLGLGEYQVKALLAMFEYYEKFGLAGNPRVLSCLLKRNPTSYAMFLHRNFREQP